MNTKKRVFAGLLFLGILPLSSCGLFNDDDIKVSNSFHPFVESSEKDPNATYIGETKGEVFEKTPNALAFKNLGYAKEGRIINTYKEGGANHKEYNVNSGKDYEASEFSNNYDLYVPSNVSKTDKHTVILFVHGGAWVSGLKTDVNAYVQEFANRGYITATIKYTLLSRKMDDASLSIFRDLDEIDACIASIKESLETLGFDTSKTSLVLGGASSGSHLAMLYSYSRGEKAALPIKFLVDAVGPVDIKPYSWKAFGNASDEVLSAGITSSAINAQIASGNIRELYIAGEEVTWNNYETMRIANGMCGIPFNAYQISSATDSEKREIVNPNAASDSMTKEGGGEDQLSVTYWMKQGPKIPIIAAYAGKDSIVGINQYATLQVALEDNSISHEFFYFKNSDHTEISEKADPTTYKAFLDKIEDWCKSI